MSSLLALLLAGCISDTDALDDRATGGDEVAALDDAPRDLGADEDLTFDDGDGDDDAIDVAKAPANAPTSQLVNPTPAGARQLPWMVRVHGRGGCSGMLIATDRVLTAAHCFCTTDVIGGNVCQTSATVTFRPNPDTGRVTAPITGTATVHPSYNPSWVENAALNDLAVVRLDTAAPSYATPVKVATALRPATYHVMLAGFGHTGSDCDGAGGSLNYQLATVDGHEADTRIMRIDGQQVCHGDSGGAVLDTSGTTLYAVISSYNLSLEHGWVTKSTNTAPYQAWIRGLTCSGELASACDSRSTMCQCNAGIGDCDVDTDCKPGLHCAQNVGASFGYPAEIDVCVGPGPLEGTCGCGDSGLGQICTPAYDQCSAGYAAVCNPHMRTPSAACGKCTCTRI